MIATAAAVVVIAAAVSCGRRVGIAAAVAVALAAAVFAGAAGAVVAAGSVAVAVTAAAPTVSRVAAAGDLAVRPGKIVLKGRWFGPGQVVQQHLALIMKLAALITQAAPFTVMRTSWFESHYGCHGTQGQALVKRGVMRKKGFLWHGRGARRHLLAFVAVALATESEQSQLQIVGLKPMFRGHGDRPLAVLSPTTELGLAERDYCNMQKRWSCQIPFLFLFFQSVTNLGDEKRRQGW